jgi:hypothetical protein
MATHLLCRHATEVDFDVGGTLEHLQMEVLLWASYRGQLLARTVRGVFAVGVAAVLHTHSSQGTGVIQV